MINGIAVSFTDDIAIERELKTCEICGESFGTTVLTAGSRYSFRESNYSRMIELTKHAISKSPSLHWSSPFFSMGIKNDDTDRRDLIFDLGKYNEKQLDLYEIRQLPF